MGTYIGSMGGGNSMVSAISVEPGGITSTGLSFASDDAGEAPTDAAAAKARPSANDVAAAKSARDCHSVGSGQASHDVVVAGSTLPLAGGVGVATGDGTALSTATSQSMAGAADCAGDTLCRGGDVGGAPGDLDGAIAAGLPTTTHGPSRPLSQLHVSSSCICTWCDSDMRESPQHELHLRLCMARNCAVPTSALRCAPASVPAVACAADRS